MPAVPSARIQTITEDVKAAPDDHFTAGPDCRVRGALAWRVDGARRRPTIVTGLYRPPVFKSPLSLSPPQTIISFPVQTAVTNSWSETSLVSAPVGQISISRVVSAARVRKGARRKADPPAPDNHLSARPDGRVSVSGIGRVVEVSGRQRLSQARDNCQPIPETG